MAASAGLEEPKDPETGLPLSSRLNGEPAGDGPGDPDPAATASEARIAKLEGRIEETELRAQKAERAALDAFVSRSAAPVAPVARRPAIEAPPTDPVSDPRKFAEWTHKAIDSVARKNEEAHNEAAIERRLDAAWIDFKTENPELAKLPERFIMTEFQDELAKLGGVIPNDLSGLKKNMKTRLESFVKEVRGPGKQDSGRTEGVSAGEGKPAGLKPKQPEAKPLSMVAQIRESQAKAGL